MEQRRTIVTSLLLVCVFISCTVVRTTHAQDDGDQSTFQYTRGPVPDVFYLGQHYPERDETVTCRPIRLRIERNSRLYRTNLVVNSNADINFPTSDTRLMTPRLTTRLNALAALFWQATGLRFTVLQAWGEYSVDDGIGDPNSLHYEGRSVRVRARQSRISLLLRLAVDAGFDWVFYASSNSVRLSVIPDVCSVDVDLVFMLDQSGSVGVDNHAIALQFMQDVVSYFNISTNTTQVGLVSYSSGARVEFGLNEHNNLHSLLSALSRIRYTGGWTTTALALLLARLMLDPTREYGARPASQGIPKVAVLLTDGRSNVYRIDEVAILLQEAGVQVYTVGIGNTYVPELQFIASDPDDLHVFLLNSFTDAPNFVDFLSFTACDSPAIVEPGDNTTTEVEEDGFRFFQSECAAFSLTVMIEQIDLVGSCSLYASTVKQNPGPLDPNDLVVRNEDRHTHKRSVHLNFPHSGLHRFVYWSVRGHYIHNTFSVIIWDEIFEEDCYTVYVSEGVSGQVLINLNAELRTTNITFNYTITDGNEGGFFDIGLQNGLLYVVSELNADQHNYLELSIVAQNSQHSCHRGRVKVKVIVIRDEISFPDLQPESIPENSDIGTEVARVEASTADSSIMYSITAGNDGNAFQIDENTGLISVASGLNFEAQNMYSLTVQARSGATGRTGTAVQVINIQDVNEPPFFTNPCGSTGICVFSVNENQPISTLVDSLTADDPDLPGTSNGMLVFSISPGATLPFTVRLNGRQADLWTTAVLDRETLDLYNFSISVFDRGTPALFSELPVTVVVNDLNDHAPVFVQPPDVLPVLESAAVTTVVTQYFATDEDIGSNEEIVFSISSDRGPLPFQINPTSGNLVVSEALDFENTTFYILNVTASNPDGLQQSTVQTVILIQDVNDNPPVFSQDEYFGSIEENSIDGTAILTVMATDRDFGDNGMIVFSIVSGNANNLIAINPLDETSGLIQMSVSGSIDREEIQMFDITVRANDLGNPQMEDFARVVINVLDINDHPPIFLPDTYETSLREDSPPTNLLTVFAFDLDQPFTPNTDLSFTITQGNTGNVFTLNKVDNNTASLRLVGLLDFETLALYELQVIAMDQGDPQMSGTATIRVTVTNVNESPPVVGGNQTIEVPETSQTGIVIATINASDADSARINFTITSVVGVGVNGDAALSVFGISEQGDVTLERALDFEASPMYVLLIQVTDGQLTTTTTLTVNVINENEFVPIFNNTSFRLSEEQPAGTEVGTAQATDADGSTVTYQIVNEGVISSLFEINEQTGVITTSQVLNREELVEQFDLFLPSRGSTSSIRVQAFDNGVPTSFFTVAELDITLLDINDNAPVFEQISDSFVASVNENRQPGETVFNGVAMDRDIGPNGNVMYSLVVADLPAGTPVPFAINPAGLVTTSVILDREERSEYTVTVTATDGGVSPLSSSATVTVTVLDENDNSPVFSPAEYDVTVPENTAVPFNVTQVMATDSDEGTRGEVTYLIQFSDPPSSTSLFSIDAISGTITLISPLDFETAPLHTLTVMARDAGAPPRSATAQVLVRVGNIDEVPPRFVAPCTVAVLESVQPGIPIMQCIAIDVDEVTNSTTGAVRYDILDGNIDDTFSVASDGTITVERNVDRETIDFYSILIQATDSVGLTDTTLLNITISDVNDNAPQFLNTPATRVVTLEDIQSHETNLFAIQATDADIGSNAELQYTLTQVTRLTNGIDSQLEITVSDRGTSSLSNTTTVTFTFEPPCTLQDYTVNVTDGRISSRFLCSVTVEPSEANVTEGTDLQLLCNVLRNTETTFEWQHNGTSITGPVTLPPSDSAGVLAISGATFQDAGDYACRVISAVGSLQSSNAVVRIQIPPVITTPPQDRAVELGRSVQFSCFATGVPAPLFEWSRMTAGGGSELITETERIFPRNNFLVIFGVVDGDQGMYTCTATNGAGSASASATLVIFGLSNIVTVQVAEFSNPNMENTCHELNTTEFESVMMDITSVSTMTTDQSGENLCNQTACSPSPCRNGGSCELQSDVIEGYMCTCSVGYSGVNCESDIDECLDDPCLSGGTCTNTNGSFVCTCLPEFTGHRCQYSSTVCDPDTQSPCPQNHTCVETVANSMDYVCVEVNTSQAVVVASGGGMTAGALDDQVNNLQEMQSTTSDQRRRRRQTANNNGFVTTCEARFLESSRTPGEFVLVWACPEGLEPPSGAELDEICQALFSTGVVTSCNSPTGVLFTQAPTQELPSTTLSISFILVDDNGAPLTGTEALVILQETKALQLLREQGYQATNFTAAVTPPPPEQAAVVDAPVGMIVGIVVAVLLAAVLAGLIFLVVCFVKQRQSRKKKTPMHNGSQIQVPPGVYQMESSHSQSQENLFENAYTYMTEQTEHQFTFTPTVTVHQPIETSPTHEEEPQKPAQTIFDDNIYGAGYKPPSLKQSPRHVKPRSPVSTPSKLARSMSAKRKSLERAASLVKERMSSLKRKRNDSGGKLLKDDNSESSSSSDDDYDHLSTPERLTPTTPTRSPQRTRLTPRHQDYHQEYDDDEPIYGNLEHSKVGAMGHAGKRWESYWKTSTMLTGSPRHGPGSPQHSQGEESPKH